MDLDSVPGWPGFDERRRTVDLGADGCAAGEVLCAGTACSTATEEQPGRNQAIEGDGRRAIQSAPRRAWLRGGWPTMAIFDPHVMVRTHLVLRPTPARPPNLLGRLVAPNLNARRTSLSTSISARRRRHASHLTDRLWRGGRAPPPRARSGGACRDGASCSTWAPTRPTTWARPRTSSRFPGGRLVLGSRTVLHEVRPHTNADVDRLAVAVGLVARTPSAGYCAIAVRGGLATGHRRELPNDVHRVNPT